MFDIHMHIIPETDDRTHEMVRPETMLEMARTEGVRAIIATPYSMAFSNTEWIMEQYLALRDYMDRNESRMTLALGCEVLFAENNTDEMIKMLESGRLPTMNGTRYVLSKFEPDVRPTYVVHVAKKLRAAGYIPVIAHAERYPGVFGNLEEAEELHNLAPFQLNACSLTEESDEGIRNTARMLLSNRLVDFIGTDKHLTDSSALNLTVGIRYIRDHCNPAYARAVLWDNAKQQLHLGEHPYLDGMLGLAVGDALGVPYENCSLQEMANNPCIGMRGNGAHRQPAGTWSDDTSMALCIADSLGTKGIDPDDVMKKFSAWKNRHQYTAAGTVFDIGLTCRRAIEKYDLGAGPELCGDYSEKGNGNGGLMRNFPIALYACRNTANMDELLRLVHSYSALTHGHPIGLICCGLYAMFLREWLEKEEGETLFSVMERAIEKGRACYAAMGGEFAAAIHRSGLFLTAEELRSKTENELPSSGYVVNTWNIAVWSLLNTNCYRDSVLKAINLGGDTDTNAAVAGSLAGFVYGCEDIPDEWLESLLNLKLIERLTGRLDNHGREDGNTPIDSFTGDYAFLAMKALSPIRMRGIGFQNLASAWFAQGVEKDHRGEFSDLNAHQARRLFRQLPHRMEWESERIGLLSDTCFEKFRQNPELKEKLLKTGTRPIVFDTTGGHDNELGRCLCEKCREQEGRNLYGRILMDVRKRLRAEGGESVP